MNNRNRFVLTAAAAVLVKAYKEAIATYQELRPLALGVRDDAPSSYAELLLDADNGVLNVTTEHSDLAIYGRDGNATFRIFHDYGHILYGKGFTTEEEVRLAQIQWGDVAMHIPAEWFQVCRIVYFADTVSQSEYEAEHGEFPENQRGFVLNILNNQLKLGFKA